MKRCGALHVDTGQREFNRFGNEARQCAGQFSFPFHVLRTLSPGLFNFWIMRSGLLPWLILSHTQEGLLYNCNANCIFMHLPSSCIQKRMTMHLANSMLDNWPVPAVAISTSIWTSLLLHAVYLLLNSVVSHSALCLPPFSLALMIATHHLVSSFIPMRFLFMCSFLLTSLEYILRFSDYTALAPYATYRSFDPSDRYD